MIVAKLKYVFGVKPMTTILGSILTIPGVLAIIYGDLTSAALGNLGANVVTRILGVMLLVGGVSTVTGAYAGDSLIELAGLATLVGGCTLYGVGVIFGLGLAGAIAGTGFLGMALGFSYKIRLILHAVKEVHNGGQPKRLPGE